MRSLDWDLEEISSLTHSLTNIDLDLDLHLWSSQSTITSYYKVHFVSFRRVLYLLYLPTYMSNLSRKRRKEGRLHSTLTLTLTPSRPKTPKHERTQAVYPFIHPSIHPPECPTVAKHESLTHDAAHQGESTESEREEREGKENMLLIPSNPLFSMCVCRLELIHQSTTSYHPSIHPSIYPQKKYGRKFPPAPSMCLVGWLVGWVG